MAPPERKLRRDAAENRERVLHAADELLGQQGLDVSMDSIAHLAGVGTGTLYRRFPSKDALIDELVADIVESVARAAEEALARDDGRGLEDFLRETASSFARRRGCLSRVWDHRRTNPRVQEVRELAARLLEQAQRHGTASPEATIGDVLLLLWALRGVIETTGEAAPGSWERHLEIHLAGLRAAPFAGPRPPMTAEEIAAVTQ
ncbi:AcrR family transcriptional regulator [Motilibacter peucedani]|uniref:AcrR family transcriptional regulator n=1 Tax=Motilibacter peucedani TaxID=598650 RepID=A0A420XJX0_9ACTN|nr:TetR/AcrR family transcriptional regulator [Motilibacter peucedani]RKS68022.1 AcrR family transcriptional regulator [Motilibacter peucedani]